MRTNVTISTVIDSSYKFGMAEVNNVLVTGAAKRLGRAIALDLARHGWNVAIHYNTSEREARVTCEDAQTANAKAVLVKANLAREGETAGLVEQAVSQLGPLTALINSASVFENDQWYSADRASWDKHMGVNLRAPLVLAQSFAKQLTRDREGAIVNLLDQRLLRPAPDFFSYGVSRAGLHWLTTTLAQALAPRIRVNAVAPGPTLKGAKQTQEHFERERTSTILGHGSEPQDICDAVRYLLGAKAVTGQTIAVDGGQHLIWDAPGIRTDAIRP
jgi:NAD(P)-dependent dehydrogenase (short-subunit alcohol dehydrogenase family)